MKGSPIIATAITIVVLLCLYLGIRAVVLPEDGSNAAVAHAGHGHEDCNHEGCSHESHDHGDHAGHNHGNAPAEHDDRALETEFELYFSSVPASVSLKQPSTGKEVLKLTDFDSPEWFGSGKLNLEGHAIELEVEVTWKDAAEMNFVQIVLNPARHAGKEKTLRSDGDISDIAEFNW